MVFCKEINLVVLTNGTCPIPIIEQHTELYPIKADNSGAG